MNNMVFSKHLAGHPLEESAAQLAKAGLTGLELTVRPGEAVEPERVAEELPAMAGKLATAGSSIGMVCSNITSADNPQTETVLRTAASLGISCYRLGEWKYQGFGTLRQQREEMKAILKDLAAMNREIGIQGLYQNHSNIFFGAIPADLDYALDDIPPSEIGVYFDPVHAVIEGGSSGWRMSMDLISERIAALGAKDYYWLDGKEGYAGARRHSMRLCPIGIGNVPWAEIITILKGLNFDGPVSFYGSKWAADGSPIKTVDELIIQLSEEKTNLTNLFQSNETDPRSFERIL
jgi:sugar phosphate isomerase/epimerase